MLGGPCARSTSSPPVELRGADFRTLSVVTSRAKIDPSAAQVNGRVHGNDMYERALLTAAESLHLVRLDMQSRSCSIHLGARSSAQPEASVASLPPAHPAHEHPPDHYPRLHCEPHLLRRRRVPRAGNNF
jgi:hypothetical protein